MNLNQKTMNNLKGKSAILYRRVSTTDQKLFGNSLNAQQSSLKEFCVKNSMIIVKEFQEDYSAKDFDRPVANEMLYYAKKNKNKIDYLLITSWDRFSRNTLEALRVIEELKKLNISVNSIDSWVDYDDPAQIMMQLMYLGMPEVDNKVRSQKVKTGMRQGLKEGRWNVKQPVGYIKGKDELGKPLMQLDPLKAPLIKKLFESFAAGLYSQNELRNMPNFKILKLSKSNLSRVLKNIVYTGKIIIPANKEETEQIVQGLHKPIIDADIFNKVQYQLSAKSKNNSKKNKKSNDLYLRGHLKCVKCSGNLTGSASTSKTGAKHYYYHCNRAKGCKESFKVKDAHIELINLFQGLKPPDEVCDLFEMVLEEHYKLSKESKYNQIKVTKESISRIKVRQQKLLEKLLDQVISDEIYKLHNGNLDKDLLEKRQELENLNDYQKDLSEYIEYGLILMQNLDTFFEQANVSVKSKLISSIFEDKIEFDGVKYRTPIFKEGFGFIYSKINELESIKNKKEDNLSKVSRLVLKAGIEPARREALDFESNVSTNSTT